MRDLEKLLGLRMVETLKMSRKSLYEVDRVVSTAYRDIFLVIWQARPQCYQWKFAMTPIGNRTRDILSCNPVTQPTAPSRTPSQNYILFKFCLLCNFFVLKYTLKTSFMITHIHTSCVCRNGHLGILASLSREGRANPFHMINTAQHPVTYLIYPPTCLLACVTFRVIKARCQRMSKAL